MKSKKQDNFSVSPLRSEGQLLSDGKAKALIDQFSSVFTRDGGDDLPPIRTYVDDVIQDIVISKEGVLKLLRNTQISKAPELGGIPNLVLRARTLPRNFPKVLGHWSPPMAKGLGECQYCPNVQEGRSPPTKLLKG